MDQDESHKQEPHDALPAGWLVLRIRPGEGVILGNGVELRLATINGRPMGDVKLAVRAPKDVMIRRVK